MSDDPNDVPDIADMLFSKRDERKAARRPAQLPSSNVTPLDDERRSRYAQKALDAELAKLSSAQQGERNDTLNSAAFNLAQLVAAGALDEHSTRAALHATAQSVGLSDSEIDKTIASGFRAGEQKPRELPAQQLVVIEHRPTIVVEQVDAPTSSELEDFWTSRKLLAHIEQFARARRASPWAVLAVVLARVVTCTPPMIVLPPIVGGIASLNLFVGLVGTSGSGKGAAERVAAECVRTKHIKQITTGSGEGIGHAYKARKKGGDGGADWLDDDHAVLFSVPEIDTLSALGARSGATLMPELRRGWSGEALGFQYADPTRRLLIEEHAYRMCLVAGIQPARAQALLDDSDGGTPQRFVWVSAADPDAPDIAPDAPAPMTWHAPHWNRPELRDLHGRIHMTVPQIARDVIDAARLARLREAGEALDGHLLLAQLKLAAAFAIADGRLDIDEHDWQLADVLTRQSTAVRAGIAQTLSAVRTDRNRAVALADAERAVIVDDVTTEAAIARVMRNVLRKLTNVDDMSSSDLRKAIAARDRPVFDVSIDRLLSTGQIKSLDAASGGVRYVVA